MKTYLSLIITIICLTLPNYASHWSLVTSLTNSGASAGGVRYDFKNNFVVDGGVSYHKSDKKESAYWVDAYYKNLGVFLSGNEYKKAQYAIMYSVEQSINDKITLGIALRLLDHDQHDDITQYMTAWDSYLVLNL